MGSTPKTLKRKGETVPGDEEEETEKVFGKKSKTDEVKSLANAIVTEEWKGPSSPAGLPSLDGRKPAEVFRTDLISAMKLPDYHILSPDTYITITDPWRQEWERGVQVPVNPEGLHQPSFREIEVAYKKSPNFKLASQLVTSETRTRPKKKCPYNLNHMDVEWLTRFNRSRRNRGNIEVEENTLEKTIAYLENKCYDNMGHAIATQDGLSIEFDEDVCCDVCQSPDAEELNEMVFCDSCDICVHQACYGIRNIPPGSYLCHPCRKRAVSPSCLLCPNAGGAMKRAKNGKDWIHVSCALWIPEVGFGNVEKMEPITRTENIPASRWNLVCVLCREKIGACIQCSVKSCVTAFHVTCGFKNGLEMKTILDDSSSDGVRHISYCAKHGHKNKSPCRSPEKEKQTKEEKETLRQKKLRQMEEEFYTFINVAEAAKDLNLPKEAMSHIHAYWALKRKAQYDVPLLPPTLQQQEKLSGKQVSADVRLQHQMEKFVRLRHDLERLRNLCYMVNRREKTRRELYRAQEQVFWKQVEILTDETRDLSEEDVKWVIEAGKGNFACSGSVSQDSGSSGGHLWSSESSADDDSDSGSSAEKSNSMQKYTKGRSEGGCSSDDRPSDEYTFQSEAETDADKPTNTAARPLPMREGRGCSRAEETKAVTVGESRGDSMPYPVTPSPSRRAQYSRKSRRNNSMSYNSVAAEEIDKPVTPRRIPERETLAPNAKVPNRSSDSSVESDTVIVPSPVRKTRKNNRGSIVSIPGRITRRNAGNEEMVSLPYYAKSPRKKSTRCQPLKQEKEASLDPVQSPARKPDEVFVESPASQGILDETALECSIDKEQDRPMVETFRRRTRSSSDAMHHGNVEVMAESLHNTPERVLRNRKREDPNSDKEQSSNASTTPLGSRRRKLEPSLNSVDTLCFTESPKVRNSRKVSVTPPRVKTEPQTSEEERLSDEEFPKENEPMSPQSRSPKRMRITADNEIVQEALERGFDAKRLRSNTNFGTGDTFIKTQSVIDNKGKKQSRITSFLHAKPGCKIKSPKELHKIRCRHRNNKTTHSRTCSQTTSNLVKNGNHEHSSSSCPDCKIQRDQYRTMSPQGQHRHVGHSPSHADRWNGIITRRDLGLRPLDSSPRSESGYQNHQITVV